jgi:hypothetical protein
LFRGQALHWLTNELATNTSLLHDYNSFQKELQSAFGVSEKVEQQSAARRIANITQRGPVQLYAIEFRQLSKTLGYTDATAKAQFTRGLKLHVREALITSDQDGDLEDLIEEAQRLDTELYSARRPARPGQSQGAGQPGARGQLKCHSCGKFGHKARDCRNKGVKQEY